MVIVADLAGELARVTMMEELATGNASFSAGEVILGWRVRGAAAADNVSLTLGKTDLLKDVVVSGDTFQPFNNDFPGLGILSPQKLVLAISANAILQIKFVPVGGLAADVLAAIEGRALQFQSYDSNDDDAPEPAAITKYRVSQGAIAGAATLKQGSTTYLDAIGETGTLFQTLAHSEPEEGIRVVDPTLIITNDALLTLGFLG